MESGTFNNIRKIGNYIVKISRNDSNISKQIIEEMDSGNLKKYISDINSVAIKTSKLYSNFSIGWYDVIIQEYIDGMTIQDILLSDKFSNKHKLFVFKRFLELYNKARNDSNLCLDWNMKNFILSNDDVYYIDFVPCLYKDKISKSISDNLAQYRESYLNETIRVAGILGYAIMPFLESSSKKDAQIILLEMKKAFNKILNVDLNFSNDDYNHVYTYKIQQIENFLSISMSFETLKEILNSYSMERISVKTREKNDSIK